MFVLLNTVKPVLRGQFWKKKQWLYKTGDLLKEVPFEIVYDRTSQKWPFDRGDCLIEVTAWAGLTVVAEYSHICFCDHLY